MTEKENYALEMKGITKAFPGVLANDDISLNVKKGEVLGLVGENGAGKTTLMNVLYGIYIPDKGQIFIDGQQADITSPSKAIDYGIGMVHQHFKLVEALSALDNVILGHSDNKRILDLAPARKRYMELCEEYELFVDPDTEIWRLSVGQQQWVEIIKALYRDAKVLVLDEPSSVLTPNECTSLFRAINKLTAEGRSIIFISHKLDEVMEITDRITVIRDGKVVGTVDTEGVTQQQLSQMMVGRPVTIVRKERPETKEMVPVLEMKNVCVNDDRGLIALQDFNLIVNSGEILGVAGVDGNGQRELAESIAGMRPLVSGSIEISGKAVTQVISDPTFMGYIPEDRHKTGMVGDFSIAENLIIKECSKKPYCKKGLLQYTVIGNHANELIDEFDVRTSSKDVPIKNLSGGNQQKVILARELNEKPNLIVASQPTRGLDLGAVNGVHDTLLRERNRGAAVLFITTELQEVMALSDRIIVLFRGKVMGILDGKDADVETIGQMMLGMSLEEAV